MQPCLYNIMTGEINTYIFASADCYDSTAKVKYTVLTVVTIVCKLVADFTLSKIGLRSRSLFLSIISSAQENIPSLGNLLAS